MEQAVNTFSKGLQLDTHPMVQGTDVLSDCLNGTLLTMNGNEVVLQNDMGNRRVNNAFLPSGYQPVGIKEYGGIIYVAAYNPITNKSQIGSFPSPQRKVDNEKDLPPTKFDFSQFFENENIEEDSYLGISVLKSDSFMIPLTENYSLRAGDKFSIYSPDLYSYIEKNQTIEGLVSNFNNVDKQIKKVYSPKNKKYTLSIGVLNSQNEFVDITKTLCRWDKNSQVIDYDSSDSDIYKFNDGYFISKEFNREDLFEDINGATLIKSRQKLAINTYAYKLIGPLYLKAQLNHIEKFDYTIDGEYDFEKGNITITGYLTYNCPDGSDYSKKGFNNDYKTFQEGVVNFNGFDLIDPTGKNNETLNNPTVTYGTSTYDLNTNTYTVEIKKTYFNVYPNEEGTSIFNYIIGVNASMDESEIYIKGLSTKGSLNFALFGSGIIKLSGWKFYNVYDNELEKNITYINMPIEAYPRKEEAFINLQITFTNLNDESNVFSYVQKYVYSENLIKLIWLDDEDSQDEIEELYEFKPNAIYRINITFEIQNEKGEIVEYNVENTSVTHTDLGNELGFIIGEIKNSTIKIDRNILSKTVDEENIISTESCRWLITSSIFNDFYNTSPEDLSDFCDNTSEEFQEKMKISLKFPLNHNVINPNIQNAPIGQTYSETNNEEIQYWEKTIVKFKYQNLTSNLQAFSNDEEFIIPYLQDNNVNVEFNNECEITASDNITIEDRSSGLSADLDNLYIITDRSFSNNGKDFNLEITLYDKLIGKAEKEMNLFIPFSISELNECFYMQDPVNDWLKIPRVDAGFLGGVTVDGEEVPAGYYAYLFQHKLTHDGGFGALGGYVLTVENLSNYIKSSFEYYYGDDEQVSQKKCCFMFAASHNGKYEFYMFWKNAKQTSEGKDMWCSISEGPFIILDNNTEISFTQEDIHQYILNKFNVEELNFSKQKVYGINNNLKFNNPYTVQLLLKIPINVINYSFSSYSIGNLEFQYISNIQDVIIAENINSSTNFQSCMQSIIDGTFNSIKDNKYYSLNPLKVYNKNLAEIEYLNTSNDIILYSKNHLINKQSKLSESEDRLIKTYLYTFNMDFIETYNL